MSDEAYRTMHWIEVYYFERGQYVKRSEEKPYLENKAAAMYQRTLNKFNENKEQIIAVLRDEKKNILKSERLNF